MNFCFLNKKMCQRTDSVQIVVEFSLSYKTTQVADASNVLGEPTDDGGTNIFKNSSSYPTVCRSSCTRCVSVS